MYSMVMVVAMAGAPEAPQCCLFKGHGHASHGHVATAPVHVAPAPVHVAPVAPAPVHVAPAPVAPVHVASHGCGGGHGGKFGFGGKFKGCFSCFSCFGKGHGGYAAAPATIITQPAPNCGTTVIPPAPGTVIVQPGTVVTPPTTVKKEMPKVTPKPSEPNKLGPAPKK